MRATQGDPEEHSHMEGKHDASWLKTYESLLLLISQVPDTESYQEHNRE